MSSPLPLLAFLVLSLLLSFSPVSSQSPSGFPEFSLSSTAVVVGDPALGRSALRASNGSQVFSLRLTPSPSLYLDKLDVYSRQWQPNWLYLPQAFASTCGFPHPLTVVSLQSGKGGSLVVAAFPQPPYPSQSTNLTLLTIPPHGTRLSCVNVTVAARTALVAYSPVSDSVALLQGGSVSVFQNSSFTGSVFSFFTGYQPTLAAFALDSGLLWAAVCDSCDAVSRRDSLVLYDRTGRSVAQYYLPYPYTPVSLVPLTGNRVAFQAVNVTGPRTASVACLLSISPGYTFTCAARLALNDSVLRGPTPDSFELYSFLSAANYSTVAVYTAVPALPSTGIPSGSTGGMGPYPPAQPPLLPYQAVRAVKVQGLPVDSMGSILVASNGFQLFAVQPDTGRVLRANASSFSPRWEAVATLQATTQRCSSEPLQARQLQTDSEGSPVFVLHPRNSPEARDPAYVLGLSGSNTSVWGNCLLVASPLTADSSSTVAYSPYTNRGLLTRSLGNGTQGGFVASASVEANSFSLVYAQVWYSNRSNTPTPETPYLSALQPSSSNAWSATCTACNSSSRVDWLVRLINSVATNSRYQTFGIVTGLVPLANGDVAYTARPYFGPGFRLCVFLPQTSQQKCLPTAQENGTLVTGPTPNSFAVLTSNVTTNTTTLTTYLQPAAISSSASPFASTGMPAPGVLTPYQQTLSLRVADAVGAARFRVSNGTHLFVIANATGSPRNLSEYVSVLRYPVMDVFMVQALQWQATLKQLCGLSSEWSLLSLQTDAVGGLVFIAFDPVTGITVLLRNSFYVWSACQQFADYPGTTVALSPIVANDFAAVRVDENDDLQVLQYRSASNVFLSYPLQMRGLSATGFAANADGSYWLTVCQNCDSSAYRTDSLLLYSANLTFTRRVESPYTPLAVTSTPSADLVFLGARQGTTSVCVLLRQASAPNCVAGLVYGASSLSRLPTDAFLLYSYQPNTGVLSVFSRQPGNGSVASTGGPRPASTAAPAPTSAPRLPSLGPFTPLPQMSVFDPYGYTPYRASNLTDSFSISNNATSWTETVLRLRLGSPYLQWEPYVPGWQEQVGTRCGLGLYGQDWRLHSLQVNFLQRPTFVAVRTNYPGGGAEVQLSLLSYTAGPGQWSVCRSTVVFADVAVSVSPTFDRVLVVSASPLRPTDYWTVSLYNGTLLAPLYSTLLPRSPAVLAASNPNADFVVTTVAPTNSTVYRLAFNLRALGSLSLPLYSVRSLIALGTGDLVFTTNRTGAELCIALDSQFYPMCGPASPLSYLFPIAYDSFSLYSAGLPETAAQVSSWKKTLVSSTGGHQPTFSTAVSPTGPPPLPSLWPFLAQTPQSVYDPLQRTPFQATNFTHLFSIANTSSSLDNVVWALQLSAPGRWVPFVGGWQQQMERTCGLDPQGVSWRLQSLQVLGTRLTIAVVAPVAGTSLLYSIKYEPSLPPGGQWSTCYTTAVLGEAAVVYDPRAERALVVSFTPTDSTFRVQLYNSSLGAPLATTFVARAGSSAVRLATSLNTYWVGVVGVDNSTLFAFSQSPYNPQILDVRAIIPLEFFVLDTFVPFSNGDVVFTGTPIWSFPLYQLCVLLSGASTRSCVHAFTNPRSYLFTGRDDFSSFFIYNASGPINDGQLYSWTRSTESSTRLPPPPPPPTMPSTGPTFPTAPTGPNPPDYPSSSTGSGDCSGTVAELQREVQFYRLVAVALGSATVVLLLVVCCMMMVLACGSRGRQGTQVNIQTASPPPPPEPSIALQRLVPQSQSLGEPLLSAPTVYYNQGTYADTGEAHTSSSSVPVPSVRYQRIH